MFKGSIPAVITPFHQNEVDYDSLHKILNYLIEKKNSFSTLFHLITAKSIQNGSNRFYVSNSHNIG